MFKRESGSSHSHHSSHRGTTVKKEKKEKKESSKDGKKDKKEGSPELYDIKPWEGSEQQRQQEQQEWERQQREQQERDRFQWAQHIEEQSAQGMSAEMLAVSRDRVTKWPCDLGCMQTKFPLHHLYFSSSTSRKRHYESEIHSQQQ